MAKSQDIDFSITLEKFSDGLAPLAHIDNRTFIGSSGQASEMVADVISNPSFIQQAPALSDLTNGDQGGVVDQLIRFILDKPTASDTTYAVGTSKLFKLSSTEVESGGSPSWPQTIPDMTEGESIIRVGSNLFVFYNKASGGDIAAMPLSTEVIDEDWGSDTDQALEKAPHPTAAKEDIMVFGNGRYLGVYIEGLGVLDAQKLDFGEGAEVADVLFHANQWWIAVNYGEGRRAQVYLYDGSAASNILSDEAGLGSQEIGFLYVLNGVVYVAFRDNTSGYFAIGWMSGRQLKPLRYFAGTLPTHRQKTLYKNTIIFISDEDILSCGAPVEQLPIQISNLADAGYPTVGAVAAPFGTPLVCSSDGDTNHRIAKFSGYSTESTWASPSLDVTDNRQLGRVTTIIVATKPLDADAKCHIKLEGNQGDKESSLYEISGEGKTRHVFRSIDMGAVEDIRVVVDYEEGDDSVTVPIRQIKILGNFVER